MSAPDADRLSCPWWGRLASGAVYTLAVAVLLGPSLVGLRVALPHDILLARLPWSATPAGVEAPRNPELSDTIDVYYPVQQELLTRLRSGADASWLRDVGFGLPGWSFLGWAALSPFNLPALALPFDLAWSWSQALRLLTAMVGAHLLARSYGSGRTGATVAGLSFGLCGYMVGWLGWPQSHVGALVPWVCWAARRSAHSDGPWWAAAALACATAGLWLGGFPAIAVYALLTAGLVAMHTAFEAGLVVRRLALALAAVAVGTALVGFTLLPTLAFLGELDLSARSDAWQARVFPFSLWTFAVPGLFGDHVHDPRWIGSAYVETAGYTGIVTLLLALPAWLLRPRRAGVWLWTGIAVGFGLLAYGFPPLVALIRLLPWLATNPPNRVLVLVGLGIAVVGGLGADALLRWLAGASRVSRGAASGLGVTALAMAAAWVALRPLAQLRGLLDDRLTDLAARASTAAAARGEALAALALIVAAAAVLIAAALLARRRPLMGARLLGGGLVIVVAVDLVAFAWGWNVQVPRGDLFPDAPGIAAVSGAQRRRAAGADGVGLPNTHLAYPGWADLRAHGFLTARQREVLDATGARFASPTVWDLAVSERGSWSPWLPAAGVAAVLVPAETSPGDATALGPVALVPVAHAVPRVYAVGRAEPVEPGAARAAVEAAGSEVLDEVVRVEPYQEHPLPELPGPDGAQASVDTVRADGGTVRATVTSEDGAVLVALDAALDGWSATVDGEPTPIVIANHLFLGVPVPPGTHEVVLRYSPPGLAPGVTLSLAGLLGLGVLGGLGFVRFRLHDGS